MSLSVGTFKAWDYIGTPLTFAFGLRKFANRARIILTKKNVSFLFLATRVHSGSKGKGA